MRQTIEPCSVYIVITLKISALYPSSESVEHILHSRAYPTGLVKEIHHLCQGKGSPKTEQNGPR